METGGKVQSLEISIVLKYWHKGTENMSKKNNPLHAVTFWGNMPTFWVPSPRKIQTHFGVGSGNIFCLELESELHQRAGVVKIGATPDPGHSILLESRFSQIELDYVQYSSIMHTKTKMNILFKNEMDSDNYLEEKTLAGVR